MASNYLGWMVDKSIPDNPDKLIFSVELIHCVMATIWPQYAGLSRNVNDLETFRDRVYNAFVGDIEDAVKKLAKEMADGIENRFIEYLQNNEEINEASFTRMADEFRNEISPLENEALPPFSPDNGDLNLRTILRYFVALGLLAGHYYSHGVTQARLLASNMVQIALPTPRFEDSDYWDALNAACRDILGYEEEVRPEDPPLLNAAEYQEHPSPRNIPDEL